MSVGCEEECVDEQEEGRKRRKRQGKQGLKKKPAFIRSLSIVILCKVKYLGCPLFFSRNKEVILD